MAHAKLLIILGFAVLAISACLGTKRDRFVIADSNRYEASLFRQNCAICHGPEGDGKILVDGTKVPSLREGEFKAPTEAAIYNQIVNGGNGMLPFRNQLTERERKMMTAFVYRDLRGN